jgi:putative ABC transport system ATP-binding protein
LAVLGGSIHAPVVAGRDLTKQYGDGPTAVHALSGVTIELEKSSFTAIMGPSGSGKSTLLHVLAGLDRPTSGEVWLGPTQLSDLGDADLTRLRRTRVGFVFQTFNLLPALTAEENIVLPLRISGAELEQQWYERLIATVGLEDRLGHRPAQLSGGEQQRVALARALITRPAVVFADEPTGNLDSAASEIVLSMLREAVDKLFQTIAIVTHDPLAAAHADRIVFLGDGRIVRRDTRLTPAQILDALKALY